MIDIKKEDLLDILKALTTITDEEGNILPNYCFASDLTMDLDCSEEEIVKFALENGYKSFKVFPGETMVGGYVVIPNDGTIKPVEKMYKDFYEVDPEIVEVKLEDDKLILKESKYTELKDNYAYDYYEVYCEKSDGDIDYDYDNFSIIIRVKKNQDKPSIEEAEEFLNNLGKLNGYKVKGVWESDDGDTFDIEDIDDETIVTYPEILTASLKESNKKLDKDKKFITVRDPNAQAMWGRCRSQTFADKTKYNRKEKHKGNNLEEEITDDMLDTIPSSKPSINLNKGQKFYVFEELNNGFGRQYSHLIRKKLFELPWTLVDSFDDAMEEFNDEDEAEAYHWFLLIDNKYQEPTFFSDYFINAVKNIPEDYTIPNVEIIDEKLDKNYLKLLARKHKKTDKKGAMGWWDGAKPHTVKGATLNKNAGNVELNVAHFNNVMGNGAQADGGIGAVGVASGGGLGESIEDDMLETHPKSNYKFTYHLVNDFIQKRYTYSEEGDPKEYWVPNIPEYAMKISRNDYMSNRLLRRRVNNFVLKGVKNFFEEHPKAMWCVIVAQDADKYDRYINVYRVLLECKKSKSIKEEIDDDMLETPPSELDDLNNIKFDAREQDDFVHKSWGWGGRLNIKVEIPKNGIKIYKSHLKNTIFCKSAKNILEKFFEEHPYNSVCILLLYDATTSEPIDLATEDIPVIRWRMDEDIEKHETLNPILFDSNGKLLPEVRHKFLEIVKEFTDGLKEDGIKFKIKDIKIVGSNCSYNYTKDSDIDLHIVMDTKSLRCPDNLYPLLYSAYRSLFNKKIEPTIKGIPVELFVETEESEEDDFNVDKDI